MKVVGSSDAGRGLLVRSSPSANFSGFILSVRPINHFGFSLIIHAHLQSRPPRFILLHTQLHNPKSDLISSILHNLKTMQLSNTHSAMHREYCQSIQTILFSPPILLMCAWNISNICSVIMSPEAVIFRRAEIVRSKFFCSKP